MEPAANHRSRSIGCLPVLCRNGESGIGICRRLSDEIFLRRGSLSVFGEYWFDHVARVSDTLLDICPVAQEQVLYSVVRAWIVVGPCDADLAAMLNLQEFENTVG